MHEALAVVKSRGGVLTPLNVAALEHTPSVAIASVFWLLSRLPWFEQAVFDYAEHAREEVRAMHAGLSTRGAKPNLDRLGIASAKETSP